MAKPKDLKDVMMATLSMETAAAASAKWKQDGIARSTLSLVRRATVEGKSAGTVTVETELFKEPKNVMTGSRWPTGMAAAFHAVLNPDGIA